MNFLGNETTCLGILTSDLCRIDLATINEFQANMNFRRTNGYRDKFWDLICAF